MNWDESSQFLIAAAFFFSSALSMIFIAILGYYVTGFLANATHQKGQEDQGQYGQNLRSKKG